MLISDFIRKFEEVIPTSLQEDWDNSGLQVGDLNTELKGIHLCVNVTEEVIDQAISNGANLIISHHPILFRETKELNYSNFISRKLFKAIKNDIAIYSSHTAIDVNGLNGYVFKEMGFKSLAKLEITQAPYGYGDVTAIPPRKVRHLADQIKEALDIDYLILYGDEDKEVSKIALVTGSGESFIKSCIDIGVELFITADIKHHDAMDALEQGLMILDIEHFQSEKLFVDYVEKIIANICEDIKISKEAIIEKYKRNIL